MSRVRAQCLVIRDSRLLMVRHQQDRKSWWCLPGGGVDPGETAEEAALRELAEECRVEGTIVGRIGHISRPPDDESLTFLVEIGDQVPRRGSDPEFEEDGQILREVRWLALPEIPERDRVFLWESGLLGVEGMLEEIESWGDEVSYPGKRKKMDG